MIRMITLSLFLTVNAFSMTRMHHQCSKKFEGKVKEIIEPEADHALSKRRVVFEVTNTLEGDVDVSETVELLKYGQVTVEKGENYQVHLGEGSLCYLGKVSL
jgi:hypothetical protein